MERLGYPTELTDAARALLAPHLPPASPHGRRRVHRFRVLMNAIFHLVRDGRAWRLLPRDLALRRTVCHYFRAWRDDGTWEQLNTACARVLRGCLETCNTDLGGNPCIWASGGAGGEGADAGGIVHQ
ncbi:MAG TPA: transposase, partial [Thermomicrobiales bacterium]